MRHKKEIIIDPSDHLAVWREQYRKDHPGGISKSPYPEGFNYGLYDAYKDHDQFCWTIRAYIRDGVFDIHGIIHSYWQLATSLSFPEEGGSLSELCYTIRRKLLKRGFKRNRIHRDVEDAIEKRFPKLIPHRLVNLQINPFIEEDFMGKKKDEDEDLKKRKKKKGYSSEDDDQDDESDRKKKKKKKSKSKKDEDDDDDDDDRKNKKKKKSKKDDSSGQCRVMCAELLMKRKFTDAQISEMIEDEIGKAYSVARVARIREGINEGKRERLGIPKPKPPLEEIVKGGKKKKRDDDDDDASDKKGKKRKKRSRDED